MPLLSCLSLKLSSGMCVSARTNINLHTSIVQVISSAFIMRGGAQLYCLGWRQQIALVVFTGSNSENSIGQVIQGQWWQIRKKWYHKQELQQRCSIKNGGKNLSIFHVLWKKKKGFPTQFWVCTWNTNRAARSKQQVAVEHSC